MTTLIADVRYGLRNLAKNPGFAAVAILTLALGIGANTAIFSVVNGLLIHPAGIPHADRLVAIRVKYDKLNLKSIGVSVPDFADVRDSKQTFSSAAIFDLADYNYAAGDWPERLSGAQVSWQWFDVFDVKPVLGRVFRPEEDQPHANHEVILAYSAWRRLFGGDPGVLDKAIVLNQESYKVVGVMGPEFRWPSQVDLWTPIGLAPAEFAAGNRFNENYAAVARMKPEVSFAQADALVKLITRQDILHDPQGAYAKDSAWGIFIVPLTDFVFGDLRTPLFILLGAVGFVLLIACSNIAGMMLAKATSRAREFAIRAALGADRWQLIRQALVESLLLATAGVLLGLLLASDGVRALLSLAPPDLTTGLAIHLDAYVLLFTIAVGLLAGLISGVAPAWFSSGTDPHSTLKEGGWSDIASRGRQRLRGALVAGELALALVLLVGAGLFLKSLSRIQEVNTGFDPHGVMTAALVLPDSQYKDDDKQIAFYRSVLDRLTASPGVRSAAFVAPLPFSGQNWSASFNVEGRVEGPGDPGPHGNVRFVTPGYFATLGIPLREGRYFTDQDRKGGAPVVLIDENLARQYWPGQDPVGKRLRQGSRSPWATIVGVVGHINHDALVGESGKGVYYYPLFQVSGTEAFVAAKTSGDPAALAGAIREAVRTADANQPVHDLKSMDERISESLGPRRFAVTLLGFFAALSLLMAALGLYALISYTVAQRTHEIGIRMSLGAQRAQVLRLVMSYAMRLAAAGVVAGAIAAVILARLLSSQLYAVGAFDPLTFGLMAVFLIFVALAASFVPARRATKVDPMVALRYE
ncbi:MAG TPA: ABC transporter permease [Terriglobia bacterium]|nr:ABC transporter permease [Terriglobia bacterium]